MIVFIGSFIKSLDGYEQQFWAKVAEYGIADQVIVTGYITDEAELYTLFEEVGSFLFLFPEGLTARRSSVIHTLQSDRPVVVTAPRTMAEFAHHAGFTRLIETGVLSFIPEGADRRAIADQLLAAAKQGKRPAPAIEWDTWWHATTAATHAAMARRQDGNDTLLRRISAAAPTMPASTSSRTAHNRTRPAPLRSSLAERVLQEIAAGALRPRVRRSHGNATPCRGVPKAPWALDRRASPSMANHYHEGDLQLHDMNFRDRRWPARTFSASWNLDAQGIARAIRLRRGLRSLEWHRSHGRTFPIRTAIAVRAMQRRFTA